MYKYLNVCKNKFGLNLNQCPRLFSQSSALKNNLNNIGLAFIQCGNFSQKVNYLNKSKSGSFKKNNFNKDQKGSFSKYSSNGRNSSYGNKTDNKFSKFGDSNRSQSKGFGNRSFDQADNNRNKSYNKSSTGNRYYDNNRSGSNNYTKSRSFDRNSKFSTYKNNNSRSNSSSNSYKKVLDINSVTPDKENPFNYSLSAVKTNNFDLHQSSENEFLNRNNYSEENSNLRSLLSSPDSPVKLSEDDIHNALLKSGKLPEFELKEIINDYKHNTDSPYLTKSVNVFLSKLNLCLNKSLVEISRLGKNNVSFFNQIFWVSLQEEILSRTDTLSNEQITDIISSFSKCPLSTNVNIFEKMEDIILDSPVKFLPSQVERLFYSYSEQRKGSTAFLKTMSRRFFRHSNLLDLSKIAKFVATLNSHPQTIKGNFGYVQELDTLIKQNINNLSLESAITIAHYLFTDNIGSNDTHRLIEKLIIERLENKVNVDMSQMLKLSKALTNYFMKQNDLCFKIKNYLDVYLKYDQKGEELNEASNLKEQNNTFGSTSNKNEQFSNINIPKLYDENDFLDYDNSEPASYQITPQSNSFNLIFNQQHTKFVTNLNHFIYCFSKNKTFRDLKENDDFKHFYSNLKQAFIKHIDYYNLREFTFSLEGLLKITDNFTYEESSIINKKIKSFGEIKNNYELVKLLKILVKNENMLIDVESYDLILDSLKKNFKELTYGEIVDFYDCISNFPAKFDNMFDHEHVQIFESKLIDILPGINIIYLCNIFSLVSKPFFLQLLSIKFMEGVTAVLNARINEVPKEMFSEILVASTKLKMTQTVENLIGILEDLSDFEDINTCFEDPKEYLNILWALLSIHNRSDWLIKINQKQSNLIEKVIQNYIFGESINSSMSKEEYISKFINNFLKEKMKISNFIDNNLKNREWIYYELLQSQFLSFLYLKDNFKLNKKEAKEFLDQLLNEIFPNSTKFSLNSRSNYISLDPASKCDKNVSENLEQEILTFFKPKPNASLYPNFIDEFLNPINLLINFELPEIKSEFEVSGIDSKVIAIMLMNKYYYHNGSLITIFENRFRILKEVFNFEVKLIKEEEWSSLRDEDKQSYLAKLLGFDFADEENVKIHLTKKNMGNEEKKVPKFNLAKKFAKK